MLPGRKGLEVLEFVEEHDGCQATAISQQIGAGDRRVQRSLEVWRYTQEGDALAGFLKFLDKAEFISGTKEQITITNLGREFLRSCKADRKKPPRLSDKITGEDKSWNKELGGGCPICKSDNTLWADWPGDYAVCRNCGAEFTKDIALDRIVMTFGKGQYRHKLLSKDGWKMVREGKEPFVCPGCGFQPKQLGKDWVGKLKEDKRRNIQCVYCGRDLLVQGNQITEEVSDDLAQSPIYMTKVLGRFGKELTIEWPDSCCVCMEPSPDRIPVSFSGSWSYGTGEITQEGTLRVPYCETCRAKDGKKLKGIGGQLLVSYFGTDGVMLIFRNPKYAREFRELNPSTHESFIGHPWPPPSSIEPI